MTSNVKQTKQVYNDFAQFGLPEVLTLGRNNNLRARVPLPKHTHRDTIEFFYLVKGKQVMGACGCGYTLSANDVFVVFPDEVHSTGIHPVGKSLFYWLQVKVRHVEEFMKLPELEADALIESLTGLPVRHFTGTERLRISLERVIGRLEERRTPMTDLLVRHHLLSFFIEIINCANNKVDPDYSPVIQTIIDHIDAHVCSYIPADDLAELANLSESRLRTRFKAEVGIPLSEFIMKAKVEKATEFLLADRLTMTQIAFTLGFSSSQYFSTVFKRFTTQTPTQFRRNSRTFA